MGPSSSFQRHSSACTPRSGRTPRTVVSPSIDNPLVIVKNCGSTAIYYEWRKVKRSDYIEAKNTDRVEKRFFCHYPRARLLPNQEKVFTISFRSTTAGIFNEELELLTEPQLLEPLPVVSLAGIATEDDLETLDEFD